MEDLEINSENVYKAFYNSYRLITHKINFGDLIVESESDELPIFLVHDPDKEVDEKLISSVIKYFEKREEYEVCSELKNTMDKLF